MKKCILGIICVILVIAFANSCGNSTKTNVNVNDSTAIADSLDSVSKKEWVYQNSVDEMDGSITKIAFIVSSNEVQFDHSYNGGSRLQIIVCRKKGEDSYVGISTSSGQFFDSELYGNNYIRVKFDNGAPIKFSTLSSLDSSFDLLCLKNSKKFIKLAKNAKTIKIEAPFFLEGSQVFTFNTNKPLEW